MSHPYPSPPQDTHPAHLLASAYHIFSQPPPPTLREILTAYKSKGDGDRDMLLAMLNAKSAEDQRIAAIANLHHKLLDSATPSSSYYHAPSPTHYPSSPSLPRLFSPDPQNVTLPSIRSVQNPRKRARSSRSPPPTDRRSADSTATEQLPPSPPFSSPGRSTMASELTTATHATSRDAMAIGSLLSSRGKLEGGDSEWPARTSSERERGSG